jgi:glycosyltransferase involved in cell wall biosynthesis
MTIMKRIPLVSTTSIGLDIGTHSIKFVKLKRKGGSCELVSYGVAPISPIKASIIIPARDAMATLPQTIHSVLNETRGEDVEVIVVNDGMDEATAQLALKYPVKLINGNGNGPAAARNIGVQASQGEILIFLDADCRVSAEWLKCHLKAHKRYEGLLAVGGSVCVEPDASFWARCDHYCSWYNVNPFRKAAWVPNHPAVNLSVSHATFERVGPFIEDLPRVGVHEETEWQGRLLDWGGRIRFEPLAAVWHIDRDDFKGYLKHNYRWGYNSITVKSGSAVSRFPWLYRKPWLSVLSFLPFAMGHTAYIVVCWLTAGKFEPLLLGPSLFFGCLAYASGMAIGGIHFLKRRKEKNKGALSANQTY